jgi:cytochrome c
MSRARTVFFASLALLFHAGLAVAQSAPPDPSVARGKRLFLQCASCHEVGDSTIVKTGPNLKGVYGRHVASLPGYAYSAALKGQDFDWDDDALDRWLQSPNQVAPGTAMAFIGLPAPDDRKAVIAYLRTLR